MPGTGILGAANLANNIASATKGLATALGLANPDPNFPQFPDQAITSQFQRNQWYANPRQGLYSFTVKPVGKDTVSEFPAFVDNIKSAFDTVSDIINGTTNTDFGEFNLPITPQEITQTEDFAVSLKPTQGGTVINHSGNKYKSLSIAGTTGVQPNKGLLGVFKDTGLAIGKEDSLEYRSGYEVFQHFRMWMRAYHEAKAQPGNESLRMVFRNYKDWEFLYVEPLKFTMKRDASKPLLYNYNITFRVLGVLTIEKPLFDLVVAKLGEVAAAVVNAYALIKTNTDASDAITGTIAGLEGSLNNLKMALKAANKDPITMAEFTSADAKTLSFNETLQLLGAIGSSITVANQDPKKAAQKGASLVDPTSVSKAADFLAKAKKPSLTNPATAQADLLAILKSEPALMKSISLQSLPPSVKLSLIQKQVAAASISKTQVKEIRDEVRTVQDKLTQGVGLGDATYNQLFGLTTTTVQTSQLTDDQFEMLYALSQMTTGIEGVLASDKLFDTNAVLLNQANSTNGAKTIGTGIFSFPDPATGTRQGFLPAGVTLEDIALRELGDSSRWIEIAELNSLKAPYIVDATDTAAPAYQVQSQNYYNPTQITDLQITYFFVVPSTPTPTGAWAGKGNYIAEYLGGSASDTSSWRFFFPNDDVVVQVTPTQQYLQFSNNTWTEIDPNNFIQDGVLKPGDKFLLPSTSAPPAATSLQGPRDNPFTTGLSASEKVLGVDLRLNSDMDLDLTQSGDLNVAVGADNGAQAIVLKLLYEKGSLKKFPTIGTNLNAGAKVPDIATVRTDITTSLLQDTRIKSVSKINIIQGNGQLSLSFDVTFIHINQAVPITIPI